MRGRLPVTLLAAAGALTGGFAAQAAASGVQAVAWAAAAGVGLTLMLRGIGLRVVGVALAALAVAGSVWAAQAGLWVAVAGFVALVVAAFGLVVWGPGWAGRAREGREAPPDLWSAMDRGDDPTDEQHVRGDGGAG